MEIAGNSKTDCKKKNIMSESENWQEFGKWNSHPLPPSHSTPFPWSSSTQSVYTLFTEKFNECGGRPRLLVLVLAFVQQPHCMRHEIAGRRMRALSTDSSIALPLIASHRISSHLICWPPSLAAFDQSGHRQTHEWMDGKEGPLFD